MVLHFRIASSRLRFDLKTFQLHIRSLYYSTATFDGLC